MTSIFSPSQYSSSEESERARRNRIWCSESDLGASEIKLWKYRSLKMPHSATIRASVLKYFSIGRLSLNLQTIRLSDCLHSQWRQPNIRGQLADVWKTLKRRNFEHASFIVALHFGRQARRLNTSNFIEMKIFHVPKPIHTNLWGFTFWFLLIPLLEDKLNTKMCINFAYARYFYDRKRNKIIFTFHFARCRTTALNVHVWGRVKM